MGPGHGGGARGFGRRARRGQVGDAVGEERALEPLTVRGGTRRCTTRTSARGPCGSGSPCTASRTSTTAARTSTRSISRRFAPHEAATRAPVLCSRIGALTPLRPARTQRIAAGKTPEFDVLLTNPPYSDDHPDRLVRFACASGKPWLLLVPNWVYTKGARHLITTYNLVTTFNAPSRSRVQRKDLFPFRALRGLQPGRDVLRHARPRARRGAQTTTGRLRWAPSAPRGSRSQAISCRRNDTRAPHPSRKRGGRTWAATPPPHPRRVQLVWKEGRDVSS
jgi:hypothetical protein